MIEVIKFDIRYLIWTISLHKIEKVLNVRLDTLEITIVYWKDKCREENK